jgi:hypothetical protein
MPAEQRDTGQDHACDQVRVPDRKLDRDPAAEGVAEDNLRAIQTGHHLGDQVGILIGSPRLRRLWRYAKPRQVKS